MIVTACLLLGLTLGPPPSAVAEPHPGRADARDTVVVLPEVRVDRERVRPAPRRLLPTAFVSEVDVAGAGRAITDLGGVLSEAAGVHVEQYGGLGAFSTVSLRAASPGQVTVFLDGVPLTSAAHGVVNLADLPATAVERIEVYRGMGPLGLGVATPGGAVNLVTVASPRLREVRLARGSFGTWEGHASAGFAHGDVSGLLHAGYQGSAGSYGYLDDNGTPYNSADDSLATRVNNRFDAWSALANLAWRPARAWRVRVRGDFFQKAQGLPGLGAVPAFSTRLAVLRSLGFAELVREGAGLAPRAALRLSAERERSRFRDTRLPDRGELGGGRHDSDDRLGSDVATLGLGWDELGGWLTLDGSASVRRERWRPSDTADGLPDPPDSRRLTRGAMAGVGIRLLDGRALLHGARRWDRVEDHLRGISAGAVTTGSDIGRELDSPQLGVRLEPVRGLELRANWACASRVPEFLELFGDQGSVTGNPALRPERAENHDFGCAAHGRRGRLAGAAEWAHFASDARDLVVYVRNSASSVKAQNLSRARIRGEELSARLELPGRLALSGAWTWQSALNQGPVPVFWLGKRLPGRPARQSFARAEWSAGGRHAVRATCDLTFIGDNVLDPYNRQRVPERRLLGAGLSFAPLAGPLRLALEGRNLTDRRAADVAGFPLPGRSLFVSCTYRRGGEPSSSDPLAARAPRKD